AHVNESNKSAHSVAAGVDGGRGQRLRLQVEIENAKQARIVTPHVSKLESGVAGERRKFFRRVLVGILGADLFASPEMEFVFGNMDKLIDFADEIHFDAAGVRIVDSAMLPLVDSEICA